MMKVFTLLAIKILFFMYLLRATKSDVPCAARQIANRSVVCVCNSTYCDTVTRDPPSPGQYVVYKSSEAGSRFKKSYGTFVKSDVSCPITFILDPSKYHQTIEGFGAAITDAAAINWVSLPTVELRQHLINSYFSDCGNQYSLLRVPIGGTDFSTHKYAYNEYPVNDAFLRNFSLSLEDFEYKIPMIKEASAVASIPIQIVSTTWAPPDWMTERNSYCDCGRLKKEYFHTYAEYHLKFIDHYTKQGIPIWAITTTNEPANGYMPFLKFNCLGWSANQMGRFISDFLGPKIRASPYKNTKILAIDDQRYNIPLYFNEMIEEHPRVLHYIDGVAVHYYGDANFSPEFLNHVTRDHPNLFLLATEACEGAYPWQTPKVDLGSWERAKNYALDIIDDLSFDMVGWIDWNICLNEIGGPVWNDNFVDSPVIVAASRGEFYKQPMFYIMGHFSKFIPRGSRRIDVKDFSCFKSKARQVFTVSPFGDDVVVRLAFMTPNNTIVVVMFNKGPAINVSIQLGDYRASVDMEASSIATVEFLYYW